MTLSNCIQRGQPRGCQSGSNYKYKDSNLSLYRTNSSQNNSVLSLINTIKDLARRIDSEFLFSDVTPDITHFSKAVALSIRKLKLACYRLNNNYSGINLFTMNDNKRYHSCTTKHSASNPRRHSLDIFVPKTYLVNTQQVTTGMNKLVLRFKRYTYGTGHSDLSCDGMSEPNKIPPWGNKFRGLNAVVVIPFIPFFKNHPTHTKHSGGHYHA